MKKFYEYLSAKGKGKPGCGVVKGTVATQIVADKLEVEPGSDKMKKPPQEKYGLGKGKHQPYTPDGKKVVSGKGGLGDQGTQDPYKVTEKKSPAKIPTVEFAYYELLPKVREAIKDCPAITENLVRELQRENLLGILVGEMLCHNETYKHIAEVMSSKNHGLNVCRKLAKAMREGVAAPFHHHGEEMPQDAHEDPGMDGMEDPNMEDPNMDDMDDLDKKPAMNFGGGEDEFGDDEFGGEEDEFGDDEFGFDDEEDDDDDNPFSPYEDELDHNPDDSKMSPDQPQLPPNPNRPGMPPKQPMSPPAMENMMRAMGTMFEGYQPVKKKKKNK